MILDHLIEQQNKTLDPKNSVWIASNAGSGKTTILTNRILALLLHGVPIERIVALTFTRSAATEMINRIHTRLQNWAIVSDEKLIQEIKMLGVSKKKLHIARNLHITILESQYGLCIQTLHAFCQSILKRFPVEANISPYFSVLSEEEDKRLLEEALQESFSPTEELNLLLEHTNYLTLMEVLSCLIRNKHIMQILQKTYPNTQSLKKEIFHILHAKKNIGCITPSNILQKKLIQYSSQYPELKNIYDQLKDPETYFSYFFTQNTQPRTKLLTVNLQKKIPEIFHLLQKEQKRLSNIMQEKKTTIIAKISLAINDLARRAYLKYEEKKLQNASLNFNDLIQYTKTLLDSSENIWVRYKLDSAIDHLLVDEAQDTNPDQWSIIRSLTEEFFTNKDSAKSILVVGDIKQSIFSFQGANLDSFLESKKFFTQKGVEPVSFTVSFRCPPAILEAIDYIFNHPSVAPLFPEKNISHVSGRPRKGLVAIIETDHIVEKCMHTIQKLFQYYCPNTNRMIQPQDIMILLQKRDPVLLTNLHRACRQNHIPICGIESTLLKDHLLIKDCLAVAQWALDSSNDLALACVLKSPFFNMSEDDLFQIAHNRPNTLWDTLKQDKKYTNLLLEMQSMTHKSAYQFFSHLIYRTDYLTKLASDALPVLDIFLDYALQEHRTLIAFLHHIAQNSPKIPITAHTENTIKLSTVHAAKGLQAPIVMLLDAHRSRNSYVSNTDQIVWTPVPIWCPSKSLESDSFSLLMKTKRIKNEEEHQRLLYVAMTRAQEALYIFSKPNSKDSSWFQTITHALKPYIVQDEDFFVYGTFPFKK